MKNIYVKIVSEAFAPVHFALQTVTDGVAKIEAALIGGVIKDYSIEKTYQNRKIQTRKKQDISVLSLEILSKYVQSEFSSDEKKAKLSQEILNKKKRIDELINKENSFEF